MPKYPLKLYENSKYYSGFYRKSREEYVAIEDCLSTEEFLPCLMIPPKEKAYPCPYADEDARIFLYGSCNLFALALQRFEYDVFEIVDSNGVSIHWFACCTHKGEKLYIDVRGATSDYTEFISPFAEKIKTGSSIYQREGEELIFEEDWADTGLAFAHLIIAENVDYYNVKDDEENVYDT